MSLIYLRAIPNLYDFLSSVQCKRWYFERCREPNSFSSHWLH